MSARASEVKNDVQGAVALGIPTKLYPFQGNYHEVSPGIRMHYLDEGAGDPVVMVHGNPSWSFYYRNLVQALSPTHRTIVPDHIGCGLSDKPGDADYTYTLSQRVDDLENLLDVLDIREKITLVVHDWGGMIGMTYATRHPERIARVVILNTGAFHLPKSKGFPLPLRITRDSRLGAMLVSRFNAFSRTAARVCVTTPMAADVAKAYMAPYNSPENRIATLRFVQDIPLKAEDRAYNVVSETESKLGELAHLPILICWGAKDFVFDRHFLARWKEIYPDAKVVEFGDAGHYVLEDRGDEIEALVKEFLSEN